jgi:hypothetical protein
MLAQEWLYGNRVTTAYDGFLERRLTIPKQFNKHSSVAVLNKIAERIVFMDDVPSLLYEMHENKQLTYMGMISTTKMPFDCFWIEYESKVGLDGTEEVVERAHYGALMHTLSDGGVRMYIVTGLDMKHEGSVEHECSLTHILEFEAWPPTLKLETPNRVGLVFNVIYAFNKGRLNPGTRDAEELGAIVCEIIFGIFLITHPRVYSAEDITFKPSHKAARASKGKPPLLEYRKIRVHIGKGKKVYSQRPSAYTHSGDTDSDDAIQHRRYHKVMGHFRHYTKNNQRSVWIEPHYRGDPALGVTFTERDVSK